MSKILSIFFMFAQTYVISRKIVNVVAQKQINFKQLFITQENPTDPADQLLLP